MIRKFLQKEGIENYRQLVEFIINYKNSGKVANFFENRSSEDACAIMKLEKWYDRDNHFKLQTLFADISQWGNSDTGVPSFERTCTGNVKFISEHILPEYVKAKDNIVDEETVNTSADQKEKTPETEKLGEINDYFQGKKESEGKLFYEIDWEFIEAVAKRMQENKGKYQPFNWTKNIDAEELKQAITRHHIEVMKGNYRDGDDELGHIVSYAANAMMLWHQLKNNKYLTFPMLQDSK